MVQPQDLLVANSTRVYSGVLKTDKSKIYGREDFSFFRRQYKCNSMGVYPAPLGVLLKVTHIPIEFLTLDIHIVRFLINFG